MAQPRLLTNTSDHADAVGADGVAGAVWSLAEVERDLDANVIALPPGGSIDRHVGPALDVLIHVIAGDGELHTDGDTIALTAGALLWLPRGSTREFRAGERGLRYVTVHRRRLDALSITARP